MHTRESIMNLMLKSLMLIYNNMNGGIPYMAGRKAEVPSTYTDTRNGNNNRNTMLLHNSDQSKYRMQGFNDNTQFFNPWIESNSKPVAPQSNKYSFKSQDSKGNPTRLWHNINFPENFRSPVDNKVTMEMLRALNNKKREKPESLNDMMFKPYNYSNDNGQSMSNRSTHFQKNNGKSRLVSSTEMPNSTIVPEQNDPNEKYYYNQDMIKEMKRDVKLDYPNYAYNKSLDGYNIDPLFPLHILPSGADLSNPVKGEALNVESKCKNCKYITPKEVMELIRKERELNEKHLTNYMMKLNKSVEKVMNNFKELSDRVLQREEKLLAHQYNQLSVRPTEEELARPIKTPIPILNPVMKPKRYEQFKSNWKKVKLFVNIGKFYFIALKMVKQRVKRETTFLNRERTKEDDHSEIRNFLQQELKLFFSEFTYIQDISFVLDEKTDEVEKIEIFSKITSLMRTLFKCLVNKTLKHGIPNLPKRLLYVLYTYVADNFYYHQTFLSSFEVFRLDFNFYGEVYKLSKSQRGMIIAFLLLNKTLIPHILLKPNLVFVKQKNDKSIVNLKYFASILHYLVRDAFKYNPIMVKDRINLTNYYRSYHLDDFSKFENAMDKFESDRDFGNLFETKSDLIKEEDLKIFFYENRTFIESFKDDIFSWASEFGHNINNLWENRKKFIKIEDIIN